MNIEVSLSDFEMEIGALVGTRRSEARGHNADTTLTHGDTSLKGHILGARGEIAIAKLFNCFPDLNIGKTDIGWDMVTSTFGSQMKVDVKTKTNPHEMYLITDRLITSVYYCIAIGTNPFKVIGIVKGEVIQKRGHQEKGWWNLEAYAIAPLEYYKGALYMGRQD